MEDIEVNTPSVEATEPAERETMDQTADAPAFEEASEEILSEEIVSEQLLIMEEPGEPDQERAGVSIREVAGGYKMATKPEHHEAVRNFVKSLKPPLKLSLPALETLAVIAYKQPVTGPEIMEIRGVQGGGVLKTLLDRKLIAVAGRKNVIGKPMLYKTTKEFLIQFGLKDLSELPSLKEFEEIRRMAFSDSETPEQPEPAPAEEAIAETPEARRRSPEAGPKPRRSRSPKRRRRPRPRNPRPTRKTSARRTSAEDPLASRRRLAPQGREDHAGGPRHGERRGGHRTRQQGRIWKPTTSKWTAS
jgi:segregation and condensation protein B